MPFIPKLVCTSQYLAVLTIVLLPLGMVRADDLPFRAKTGMQIETRGGQLDVVGRSLYFDEEIEVFEYKDHIYKKDACYNGTYSLTVIHKVVPQHLFSLGYLSAIYERVLKRMEGSECGAKYLQLNHYVKGINLWKSESYVAGATLETSSIKLLGWPIIQTTAKIVNAYRDEGGNVDFSQYGFCMDGKCWRMPWGDLHRGDLSAESVQAEMNKVLFSNIEYISKNWKANDEKIRAQRELARARREVNEIGAALIIIMALGGMIESSPCNDPERRNTTSGC